MAERHAVILAGALRPSPLRAAIQVPELCLPVAAGRLLLDAWRSSLETAGPLASVHVVVHDETDVRSVSAVVRGGIGPDWCRVITEPSPWRGTAGILRDVTGDLGADDAVIVVEGACLPPERGTGALFGEGTPPLLVGVCGEDEPAGVYALTRDAIARAPEVGYHDLKEQLLPALRDAGLRVRTIRLGERARRLRDLDSYLAAVRQHRLVGAEAPDEPDPRSITPQTSVSRSAVVDGDSIVELGVVIEDGAIVHDSVVLSGATIGAGAVVTRSVVAPMAVVRPNTRVIRQVVVRGPEEPLRARPREPRASDAA